MERKTAKLAETRRKIKWLPGFVGHGTFHSIQNSVMPIDNNSKKDLGHDFGQDAMSENNFGSGASNPSKREEDLK